MKLYGPKKDLGELAFLSLFLPGLIYFVNVVLGNI